MPARSFGRPDTRGAAVSEAVVDTLASTAAAGPEAAARPTAMAAGAAAATGASASSTTAEVAARGWAKLAASGTASSAAAGSATTLAASGSSTTTEVAARGWAKLAAPGTTSSEAAAETFPGSAAAVPGAAGAGHALQLAACGSASSEAVVDTLPSTGAAGPGAVARQTATAPGDATAWGASASATTAEVAARGCATASSKEVVDTLAGSATAGPGAAGVGQTCMATMPPTSMVTGTCDPGEAGKRKAATSTDEAQARESDSDGDFALSDDSGASDAEDLFHLAVGAEETRGFTTREDTELELATVLARQLRDRPLLPPDPMSPEKAWTDVHSGVRLPRAHCAFRGCAWTLGWQDPSDREGTLEGRISEHLIADHEGVFSDIDAFLQTTEASFEKTAEYLAYYCFAIRIIERRGVPLVGYSSDRRTFAHVLEEYNSESLRSLVCVCCAQIFVDTGDSNSLIRFSKGDEQVFNLLVPEPLPDVRPAAAIGECFRCTRPQEGKNLCKGCHWKQHRNEKKRACFEANFCLDTFVKRYANSGPLHRAQVFAPGACEWTQRLTMMPGLPRILCCPEDVRCAAHGRGEEICPECEVPICSRCAEWLPHGKTTASNWNPHGRTTGSIPMALANDNFIGYAPSMLYTENVRWIEAAAASPVWNTLTVFYLEADRGHLMTETCGQQKHRTGVRGNLFSVMMPWEDILASMLQVARGIVQSKAPSEQALPNSGPALAAMVRLHLRVAVTDCSRYIAHARLRPRVVLKLLHELIDHGHIAFAGQEQQQNVAQLKDLMAAAVEAKFPSAIYHDADGHVPPEVEQVMFDTMDPRQSRTREDGQSKVFQKSAVPGDGVGTAAEVFDGMRPNALVVERSAGNVEDPNAVRTGAHSNYSDLVVQTGSDLIDQWESWYPMQAFPMTFPFMVGGPEYRPRSEDLAKAAAMEAEEKRKPVREQSEAKLRAAAQKKPRRPPDAPRVTPFLWTRSMPRRVEGQLRGDWVAVPGIRNLYFRWSLLQTDKLSVECKIFKMSDLGDASENATANILAAAGLCKALHTGHMVTKGGRKVPIAGDTTRLPFAEGLTARQRALAKSVSYAASQQEGTQQVRVKIGKALLGARVTYGDCIFMTIAPNEKHSGLVLRLSRRRRNDPIVQSDAQKDMCGWRCPKLEARLFPLSSFSLPPLLLLSSSSLPVLLLRPSSSHPPLFLLSSSSLPSLFLLVSSPHPPLFLLASSSLPPLFLPTSSSLPSLFLLSSSSRPPLYLLCSSCIL